MSVTSSRWQKIIVTIYQFLLFFTPLAFTWINEELFEFNKMVLVYTAATLVGGVWLCNMAWERRIIWRRTVFDLPIGVFLLSQLLSTLFSIHPHTSLFGYYTRFNGGLLSTVSYIVLFAAFVTYVERKHLQTIFLSLFSSAFLVTAMAIPEHFGHAFSCLLITTNRQMATGAAHTFSLQNLWSNYDVSCWIQDVQNRVYATFGQPNWLAAYAITLLPISLAFTLREPNGLAASTVKNTPQTSKKSFLWGALSVALFLTVLFTKSRSGFLGMCVGLVFTGATVLATKKEKFLPWKTFFVVAGILVVSLLYFGSPYTPSLSAMLQKNSASKTPATKLVANTTNTAATTSSTATTAASPASEDATPQPANRLDEGGTDSGEIRKIVWTGAFKIWKKYPIFGSGVETFAYSYFGERPMEHNNVSEWDFLYNKAHNEFLNFLATTGAFGLLSYSAMLLSFVAIPLYIIFQKQKAPENSLSQFAENLYLAAIPAGIIGLSISNFFGFSTVMVSLLLFLLPAFVVVYEQKFTWEEIKAAKMASETLQKTSPTTPTLTSYALLSISIMLTSILVWNVFLYWYADAKFAEGKQFTAAGQLQPALADFDKAVQLNQDEAYFWDELGILYGSVAQSLAEAGDASGAAQIAQLAIQTGNKTVELNPVHPNYYKSLTRIYLNLALFNPEYLKDAETALKAGTELAPTDPKLRYNLALIREGLEENDQALADFEQTVAMKPNYEDARMTLADRYEKRGMFIEAREQYQYIIDKIQPANEKAQQKLKELPMVNKLATPSAAVKAATSSAKNVKR